MSEAWGSLKEIYTKMCMDILHHRYRYYVLNNPLISDLDYDILEKQLIEFEKINPTLKHPNSPTGYPGSDKKEIYPSSIKRLYEKKENYNTKPTLW